ncbi:helix-turn-helix transcriptional regulator [Streptomyces sp. NPDC048192]|uniref:helix-turn-helix transcriptional regulator n=1 Tax=Streptomyces sp. NPDC048192 TaxID=3365510 RepID=UPI00371EC01C
MNCVPDDLIKVTDAAKVLRVSGTTVYNMIKRGELIGYRATSGSLCVSEAEVHSLLSYVTPPSVTLDAHIALIVDAAPSLTPEQRERLRSLLAPVPAQSEAA